MVKHENRLMIAHTLRDIRAAAGALWNAIKGAIGQAPQPVPVRIPARPNPGPRGIPPAR